jgi:hypothetical protein
VDEVWRGFEEWGYRRGGVKGVLIGLVWLMLWGGGVVVIEAMGGGLRVRFWVLIIITHKKNIQMRR